MMPSNGKRILGQIAELVARIQRETKIGTAFEKYDTKYLWKLGEEIKFYSEVAKNKEDAVAEILFYLSGKNIRCTPVLLKNAETARRSWKSENDYLQDVNDASYGKLKAILPVLDPDFVSQTKLSETERKGLLRGLNKATYEEVLTKVREIRRIYDPASLSVDLDQFYSDLHSLNSYLESAVTKQNREILNMIRSRYRSQLVNDVRMLLAALRSEEAFQKLDRSAPREIKAIPNSADEGDDFNTWFSSIVRVLIILRRGTAFSREKVRQRIGVSKLGELSTLLKAASNDEELERYRRGRELLEKIRSPSLAG